MAGPKPVGQTFALGQGVAGVTVLVDDTDIVELIKKIQNTEPALKKVGVELMELVDNSFDTATGPEGRQWLPLKPESIERREHGGDLPLQDTGVLRDSFNARVVEGGTAVSIGTNFGFYTYHQHDPDYPIDKHIIPIRNVLPIKHQPLPDSWRAAIITELEAHLALEAGA